MEMDDIKGADDDGRTDTESDAHEREELFTTISEWILADKDHSANWRTQAKRDFDFVSGAGQWEPEDVEHLRNEKRPVITFNQTSKYVRMVCGLEINNRQMTTYLPRDVRNAGEVKANELLTNASDWMAQGCDASRHQSRAFRDTVICGMGWTEGVIDYDEDPQGKYIETRVNPLEMGWDCNSRDLNLQDAKRVWRVREMLLSEAKMLVPGVTDKADPNDLDASWIGDINTDSQQIKTKSQKELREENTEVSSDPLRRVRIVQVQWWELEPYVKTIDPGTGQSIDVTEDQYEMISEIWLQRTGQTLPRADLRRKVFKQALVGGRVLDAGPCPVRDGFSFHAITGEPEDNQGTYYGIVRLLRDPQIWSNKFFSQLMHIINSQSKGGVMAESDAFPDVRQAQASWAKPNAITIVSPGAISKGKIQPKPGTQINGGILQLMDISNQMFSQTTGMNLELMGTADRQQPGVLEAQRKQAAVTIMATLFDSLSAFRRDIGHMRLAYIQDYLADGRLIRIHGDDGAQAIPLLKDETLGQYDVIVDDAPSSTSMKEKAWASLMMILPTVQHMLTPQVVAMLLDYVPHLPSRLVEELKAIASQPPPPEQVEAQKRQQEAELGEKEAGIVKDKASAVLDLAKAASEKAQQRLATIQAIDAELVGAGLMDRPSMDADETIMGPVSGIPERPPMPMQQQEPAGAMPEGSPDVALPGIFGGR